MRLSRSEQLGEGRYSASVAKGLNKVFEPPFWRRHRGRTFTRNLTLPVEAQDLKVVVFSDLHRGTWDGADDFRRSHRAYRAALGWYLERGYELWLLGDVEELWENSAKDVIKKYEAVMQLEQRFAAADGPGLRRFYGNHDLDWNSPKRVKAHLEGWIGKTSVIESLRLQVREHGENLGLIFFVHGHQGTPGSDTFAFFSRFVVRVVWRAAQRSQGWLATTPAESPDVRDKHDRAMLDWAQSRLRTDAPGERPVLVAGHTHHPVFPGTPPSRPTKEDIATVQTELDNEQDPALRAEIRARLELLAAEVWEEPYVVPHINPPCYFNTGCCSFPDGDVTCLEISGEQLRDIDDKTDGRGKIRLMRWPDNDGGPVPHELASRPLREVLEAMNAG